MIARLDPEPTELPIYFVCWVLSGNMELTSHLHVVLMFRICTTAFSSTYFFRAWCLMKHRGNFILFLSQHTPYNIPELMWNKIQKVCQDSSQYWH
jgi:hypothetical protein